MAMTMKANVFHGPNDIRIEEVERPHAGPREAVIRITLTTICGTDLHIVRGEYPVRPGLIIGHEPVGVIDELGPGVTGYEVGDRVLVGAITPADNASPAFRDTYPNADTAEAMKPLAAGGFGNTINGRAGRISPRSFGRRPTLRKSRTT